MIFFKKRHRERVAAQPFPEAWARVLDTQVPLYGTLDEDERRELRGLIQIFVDEKEFEGCGGLEITDDIRVIVAAQACILLLGRETDIYPRLRTILVYPHPYQAHAVENLGGGLVVEGEQARSGESWSYGTVVLSWDTVQHDAMDIHDGHNLVLHEFAHQLDSEDGAADGAPVLPRRSMYVAWARVLGHEYQTLIEAVDRHRPTVLDKYGATNPAEFFAVATECFFERPVPLARKNPELYDQLRSFYGRDPAARPRPERTKPADQAP
ncbi:MAG: zinc-dependent peptidase [Acidobacteria bacterium]|nr:zinc-dependent peptidase [Acidobacteriota bacterium]